MSAGLDVDGGQLRAWADKPDRPARKVVSIASDVQDPITQ